jgi:predicted ester cyclase
MRNASGLDGRCRVSGGYPHLIPGHKVSPVSDGRDVLRSWFDLWNAHAPERLSEVVTPDYVHHTMGRQDLDLAGFQQGFRAVLEGFPDVIYTVEHSLVEGNMAAAYLRAEATHRGDYFGIPATGQRVTFTGIYHCRISAERIREDWDVFDLLTPLMRLGASISPPSNER